MKLVVATPEQQLERDALTFEVWGGGLTAAQFQQRELELRGHRWAKRTMTSWCWCAGDGSVLASCESFLDGARAGERWGTAATIASVFTEPSLRGQGHAARMLEAVLVELKKDPNCLAATLFSEIGAGLYQRLGFWPVPAFDTWFPPSPTPPGIQWLTESLPAPRHAPCERGALRVELSEARLDWHLARERIYAQALGRTPLRVHGARMGERSITWTAYWKTNELQVLTLDARSAEEAAPLILAAQHAAHLAGLPTVRVWETMNLMNLSHARRAERTDELAMFCPLVTGLHAWTEVERGAWA
jgi:GNAT superfamily N-acetyltransferase